MGCYRVWMKDGYCRLVNAVTEKEAREVAKNLSTQDCQGAVMSKREYLKAIIVDYVENLSAQAVAERVINGIL